ncbi:MAG: hypothetical protein Kow00128_02770 [Deltaproteobacteria bacterium]
MRRGSLFLRFFLVVCACGAVVGVTAWFVVSAQLRHTLTQMEKRPLEMVSREILSIASETFHGLLDYRKETDPTAVRTARLDVRARIANYHAAGRKFPYHFAVLDEEGRILVDSGGLLDPSSPPPVENRRKTEEVSFRDRQGRMLIGIHSYFPAWRWHLLTLVPEEALAGEADRILYLVLGAGIVAAVLVLLLSYLLMRRYIQRPLSGLIAYARTIMDGRYDVVPVGGTGEIRELSEAFHRMTEAIREREKSLTELAKFTAANPNLVMKVDPEGRILYANQGVERTLFSMGLPPQHGELLLPDGVETVIRGFLASKETTRELTCRAEGRTIHYTIFGFEDEEAVVFHGEDVTEKSALEEELQQARKMETLGRIAGGIAHDFNNLLSGILGYASLLKQEPGGDSRVARAATQIEKAAERGAQMTRQLLGFARKGTVEHLPVDLNRIAGEVVDIVSKTFLRNITPVQEAAEDLPAVLGDATQLTQCLMNLCINARDAMPRGGHLTISTRRTVYPEEVRKGAVRIPAGTYATVIVRDEGEGMDAAILGRIFDPFFTTKDREQGTGLGLSLVYGIVTNHGGFISVDSEPEKGTAVRIDLPACDRPLPRPEEAPEPPPRKEAAPSRQGTVLLVDDEDLVRDVAGAMLVSLGFEILTASNGKEGVEVFRRERSRILFTILDLRMPVMDGSQAFEEIRKIDPEARIVISTGFSGDEDVDRLKEQGAAAILSKPYTYGQISRVAGLFPAAPSSLPVETP